VAKDGKMEQEVSIYNSVGQKQMVWSRSPGINYDPSERLKEAAKWSGRDLPQWRPSQACILTLMRES
jgi:hypothetical protein